MLQVGEKVLKGQIIGKVGPKNVYGVLGNRYYDSNGNPTNGATTGPHLHFGMRINNEYVNPLNYLPSDWQTAIFCDKIFPIDRCIFIFQKETNNWRKKE